MEANGGFVERAASVQIRHVEHGVLERMMLNGGSKTCCGIGMVFP